MPLKVLVDENIRKEIATFLANNGCDVKRMPAGTLDDRIAEVAKKEQRILITNDLDFSKIFRYPPEQYAGIVVIRIIPPLVATTLAALNKLLKALNPEDFLGRLIILEPNRIRIFKKTL